MEQIFVWTNDLDIGVESVNSDHKKLIDILNSLAKACSEGKGEQVVGDIVDELLFYTIYHFDREEALMAEHDYPDLDAHRRAHAGFIEKVTGLKDKLDEGVDDLCGDVLVFLKQWLTAHIMQEDKKLGPFLKEKGVI